MSLTGTVAGPSGIPVVGATVYLVPNTAISTEEITGAGVLAGTTLDFDEPLEDAVALDGTRFIRATTDANGDYSIPTVPDGRFFLYVEPAGGDLEHLPGGNLCRVSNDAATYRAADIDVIMSSSPGAAATYVGMTTCLTCHTEYTGSHKLAHRLGFKVPGVTSPLQDISYHPEIDEGLTYFLDVAVYSDGTPVYHYDYDSTRGFDKYKTSLTDPGGGVSMILWLWRDTADTEYKITFDNVSNAADPMDLETRMVKLTYGGAVQKQRYMLEWQDAVNGAVDDRNGLYPSLQFQTDGDDARYDRTRKVFRDYHLDFFVDNNGTTADISDDFIKVPDITKNISRNCIGCHAGGYQQYLDPDTNEVLAHMITDDVGGSYDIDGDGLKDDLNTGCENCHGAGSDHVTANNARYMVTPDYLSPSRSNQLCGRCHNRQTGNDTALGGGGDHPLTVNGEWPEPGISRADFLADHVKADNMGPKQSKYWADFTHPKSHHQQYPDWIKSKHYRNPYRLVSCFDCHDMHGNHDAPRALIADPDEPDTPLCMNCHEAYIGSTAEHTADMLGVAHGAATAACQDCHQNKMSKSGAGKYGFLMSAPTGGAGDVTEIYFDNDISSHVFDVPGKMNVGVSGIQPDKAMPIPYTQDCSVCHDPSMIQNQ